MKHARKDYDRIQAPTDLIPADEPVFLLRSQDKLSADIVDFWADMAEDMGCGKEIVASARQQAVEMRRWQKEHAYKTPDMPEGMGIA